MMVDAKNWPRLVTGSSTCGRVIGGGVGERAPQSDASDSVTDGAVEASVRASEVVRRGFGRRIVALLSGYCASDTPSPMRKSSGSGSDFRRLGGGLPGCSKSEDEWVPAVRRVFPVQMISAGVPGEKRLVGDEAPDRDVEELEMIRDALGEVLMEYIDCEWGSEE